MTTLPPLSLPVPPQVLVHWKVPAELNLDRKTSVTPFELWIFVPDPGSNSTVPLKKPVT